MSNLRTVTFDIDVLKSAFVRFPMSAGAVNAICSALGIEGDERNDPTVTESNVNQSQTEL